MVSIDLMVRKLIPEGFTIVLPGTSLLDVLFHGSLGAS